jgi:putative membrane protein
MRKPCSMLLLLMTGIPALGYSQTPSPTSPAGASSPHQRDSSNSASTEVSPSSGTDPGSMASPHQQNVTQAPGRGAAQTPMFVKMAALSGMTEVELGKLAQNKSSNPDIKQFASTMITDHTKANTELQAIASAKGLGMPTGLDADHAAMVKSLSNKTGRDFDSAYAKHMVADHDQAVALFKTEINDTDPEMAGFAQKTLPVLQQHQQMAQRLASM